jgi:hypothetical protein
MWATFTIFKKLLSINNISLGEDPPNLVTLVVDNDAILRQLCTSGGTFATYKSKLEYAYLPTYWKMDNMFRIFVEP